MCHEGTSVGLPESIGIGKGTVTLDDFALADAIFCISHNPGTNPPRMLSTLSEAARRGVPIVVANPMKERGLERFKTTLHPTEKIERASSRDRVCQSVTISEGSVTSTTTLHTRHISDLHQLTTYTYL